MGPSLGLDGIFDTSQHQETGIQALPGSSDDIWDKSHIGSTAKWNNTLKSFAAYITTLPFPAALYWGDELVLLHNESWKAAADGQAKQGAAQKEELSEEALSMVRTAMIGNSRQTLQAEMFLKTKAHDGVSYQAILSPVMDPEVQTSRGVLIQLFETDAKQESKKNEQQSLLTRVQEVLSLKGADRDTKATGIFDKLPLDENPFFQRFASLLPTGMAILNHKADAVFVNEQFYELTTSGGQNFKSWPQSIHPDDYDRVMDAYRGAFKSPGKTVRCEFRTTGPEEVWRLLMLSPLGDSRMRDGSIEKYGGFVCAVIDITPNKKQELAQKKAAQEALERKEQQERFIDMISHEIRNPLSAVLHCAEEILEIMESRKDSQQAMDEGDISALVESAETIKLCVAHQKNIVDDILSFSKLDASMLSLAPKSVQPKRQIGDSLKMFQPEIKKQHMQLDYTIDTSFEENEVDWVKADLVRISQILVNLITNAIKFTAKKDGEKKITCMMGCSLERPTSYPPNVVFFDPEDLGFRMDGTNTNEWGNGEAMYIMIAVKDTGIGISNAEQKKLFERFRQASPKTEETYGGSGLGLMISRKLCQLHGGEIGVSSIKGVGSTFAFFFRVRRVDVGNDKPERKDRLGSADLMDHLQHVTSGRAPIQHVGSEDKQEKLVHPKVEHTEEASGVSAGDKKFHNTAEVASHVKQLGGDEYGQKSRPPASTRVSSSGSSPPTTLERLQSKTDSFASNKSSLRGSPTPGEERAHVLLVEDNVINQRILKRKLEAKKFRVTTANNGREAVNSMKGTLTSDANSGTSAGHFDVVLMDQEMPVLDGNAATKEIRKLEGERDGGHIPILGVTANVRDPQKEQMRLAGMDDVISKPYSMEDLISRIEGLVKDSSQHEQSHQQTEGNTSSS